tara:strand:- start:2152 stop:3177 length:1026 start_codon:yes stop_codon:yes gene_type:complete
MKKTVLIYFFSDYNESFINLYASINKLGLLTPPNLYSIFISKSISKIKDNSIIKKFNKHLQTNNDSDLSGYLEGLNNIETEDFDYFIFMNSSCIGPILPVYTKIQDWTSIFTSELDSNGLVAPIIEFPPFKDKYMNKIKTSDNFSSIKSLNSIPFAHSYFFALNKKSTSCIMKNNALPNKDLNKNDAVGTYERLITATLLNHKFTIKSFLYKYFFKEINKMTINKIISDEEFISFLKENKTDPETPNNGYFGSDLSPYEVVFYKNLRYPHSHRGIESAGISKNNLNFLNNIIGLNKIRLKFNLEESIYLNEFENPVIFNDKFLPINSLRKKIKKFLMNIFK